MNTFKHKSLYAALAGLGALGATGVAQAVSVNHDGLGQVLLYPYYTVRVVPTGLIGADAAYNSLLSVVNSTGSGKVVKVRFLEGKASKEVLDFNVYLSAKDVWTAAIIPTTDGAGIFTADKSCTQPKVSSSSASPTLFVNFAYTGDTGGDTLDRTREGYVEIIELGDVIGSTLTAITHSPPGGSPPCTPSALVAPTAPANTIVGTGGLFGSMTLINVLKGEDFGVDPTALDGFSTIPQWTDGGSTLPTLAAVNPKRSVYVSRTNVYITDWSTSGNAADPVSAVLMHDNVYNEYVLEPTTKSGTDWVVTFPTKRNYVATGSGLASKLFEKNFNNGSCDAVQITVYDREEASFTPEGGFSPPPPTIFDSICYEANVVNFRFGGSYSGTSSVLGSKNSVSINSQYTAGWAALGFINANVTAGRHVLVGGPSTVFNTVTGGTGGLAATTFNGLPTIGFAAITFENGNFNVGGSTIQSNYGGNFNHKLTNSVQ